MTKRLKAKSAQPEPGCAPSMRAGLRAFDHLGLRETEDFVLGDAALRPEDVEALVTLHHIALFADFAADAETRMLGHAVTSLC